VQELERRRELMETVLESIPTAVLSLERTRASCAPIPRRAYLRPCCPASETLDDLLGPESSRVVQNLMRRSLRMGCRSREVECCRWRVLHAAVTVSSLGPRRANSGYVLVVDGLTESFSRKNPPPGRKSSPHRPRIKNPLTSDSTSLPRALSAISSAAPNPKPPSRLIPN